MSHPGPAAAWAIEQVEAVRDDPPLSRVLGDPRLGMAGAFLSLGRVLPDRYPLDRDLGAYLNTEHSLGRLLDFGVIQPRLTPLYDWSAAELGEDGLRGLLRDGWPAYAWPVADHEAWELSNPSLAVRAVRSATAVMA